MLYNIIWTPAAENEDVGQKDNKIHKSKFYIKRASGCD